MLSIGLWRWYINITIIILDIIRRPVFYLKKDVSETGFCLSLQVKPTRVDPIERASLCLCPSCTHPSSPCIRNSVSCPGFTHITFHDALHSSKQLHSRAPISVRHVPSCCFTRLGATVHNNGEASRSLCTFTPPDDIQVMYAFKYVTNLQCFICQNDALNIYIIIIITPWL
jgi:hypothetical protein